MSGRDERSLACGCGGTVFKQRHHGVLTSRIDVEIQRIYDDDWEDTRSIGWTCNDCGKQALGDLLDLIISIQAGF